MAIVKNLSEKFKEDARERIFKSFSESYRKRKGMLLENVVILHHNTETDTVGFEIVYNNSKPKCPHCNKEPKGFGGCADGRCYEC